MSLSKCQEHVNEPWAPQSGSPQSLLQGCSPGCSQDASAGCSRDAHQDAARMLTGMQPGCLCGTSAFAARSLHTMARGKGRGVLVTGSGVAEFARLWLWQSRWQANTRGSSCSTGELGKGSLRMGDLQIAWLRFLTTDNSLDDVTLDRGRW